MTAGGNIKIALLHIYLYIHCIYLYPIDDVNVFYKCHYTCNDMYIHVHVYPVDVREMLTL